MAIYKRGFLFNLFFALSLFLFSGCFKDLTNTDVVYENDFNNGNLFKVMVAGWNSSFTVFAPVSDNRVNDFNGEKMIGKLNNNSVQLQLTNLPNHELLRVEFDLYLHNNWRNDLWHFSIDGADQLLTGFSNTDTVKQSYPNWLGTGTGLGPAGRNAMSIDLPAVCNRVNSSFGSSQYRIVRTLSHKGSSVDLVYGDSGGTPNDTCTRSWSMDNLKVSVIRN